MLDYWQQMCRSMYQFVSYVHRSLLADVENETENLLSHHHLHHRRIRRNIDENRWLLDVKEVIVVDEDIHRSDTNVLHNPKAIIDSYEWDYLLDAKVIVIQSNWSVEMSKKVVHGWMMRPVGEFHHHPLDSNRNWEFHCRIRVEDFAHESFRQLLIHLHGVDEG